MSPPQTSSRMSRSVCGLRAAHASRSRPGGCTRVTKVGLRRRRRRRVRPPPWPVSARPLRPILRCAPLQHPVYHWAHAKTFNGGQMKRTDQLVADLHDLEMTGLALAELRSLHQRVTFSSVRDYCACGRGRNRTTRHSIGSRAHPSGSCRICASAQPEISRIQA